VWLLVIGLGAAVAISDVPLIEGRPRGVGRHVRKHSRQDAASQNQPDERAKARKAHIVEDRDIHAEGENHSDGYDNVRATAQPSPLNEGFVIGSPTSVRDDRGARTRLGKLGVISTPLDRRDPRERAGREQ